MAEVMKIINPFTNKNIAKFGSIHNKLMKEAILDMDGLQICDNNQLKEKNILFTKESPKKEVVETVTIKSMVFNKEALIEKNLIKKDGTILEKSKVDLLKKHAND